MAVSDREVLLALYRATGGDQWIRNDGWCDADPISEWYGVGVRDGRVVDLNLSNNNLQGSIPEELGLLTNLTSLYLSNNMLTGFIPAQLGQLSNLRHLYLSFNRLTGFIPIELGKLSNLYKLSLSYNRLTGSVPRELGQLNVYGQIELSGNMLDVESSGIWIAKEAQTGKDRLDYERYAAALAGLFRTGELDNLPTAIGIYAPWGGGKSFLLRLLQIELQKKTLKRRGCISVLLLAIWRGTLMVILRVMLASLYTWLWEAFFHGVGYSRIDIENPDEDGNGPRGYRDFIFVEFNAWECAKSQVLWASLITKIFDKVEGHEQFGRGLVRATRLQKLLLGHEWNWCGLVAFYLTVAVLGVTVVILINITGLVAGTIAVGQWATVVLGLPGILTFLRVLFQLRTTRFLRTAQTVLQDAASKKESVGASYRGFMSEVKEELEILFEVINKHNKDAPKEGNAYTLAVIIDDLDRCPKHQIVDMLRAIHLLLEQPSAPMAVFLAVDPRLIVSAVAEVLDKEPGEVTGLEYLDKIIHIPFCLPRISKRERTRYLGILLDGDDNSCTKTLRRLEHHSNMPSAKAIVVESFLEWCGLYYHIGTKEHSAPLGFVSGWLNGVSGDVTRRVKDGRKLLDVLHMWEDRELLADALQRFKSKTNHFMTVKECEGYFEELNAEVNQLVFERSEGTAEARTSTEQKDSGEIGSTPLESQNTSQLGGQAPLQPLEPSAGVGGQSFGTVSPGFPSVQAISQMRKHLPSRTISTEERKAFENIFDFIITTPRKMKRLVNVYVLQRYLFLGAFEQRGVSVDKEKDLRRALVTWTTLAEFWPMRLSWVVHEMEASQDPDKTIVDIYGNEDTKNSACALIHGILGEEGGMKALYFSDAPEKGFEMVVKHGEQITKTLVLRAGGLLEHSFNLNPAIITLVENIKRTRIQGGNESTGVEEMKGDRRV